MLGERKFEDLRAWNWARKVRAGRCRPDEVDLLPRLLGPGDTAVDVGANMGIYTYHLALLTGDSGRVYAFEAVPDTCRSLRRVLALLGVADRVEVIEKAAGERSGSIEFAIPRRADGSVQSGRASAVFANGDRQRAGGPTLPLTRLDDEIPTEQEVSFVKVDVEGADLFALRGSEGIIARYHPTLLIEIAPRLLARNGLSGADVDAFLGERGYTTYVYDPATGGLESAAANEVSGNLLAVHAGRAAQIV